MKLKVVKVSAVIMLVLSVVGCGQNNVEDGQAEIYDVALDTINVEDTYDIEEINTEVDNVELETQKDEPVVDEKNTTVETKDEEAEPKVEPKAETIPEPKAEPKTEPVAEPKTEPKTEPVVEPKAEPVAEPEKVESKGSFSDKDLVLVGSKDKIKLGDSDSKIEKALGTNYTKSDVVSCVNDGTDSVYIFSGLEILTYEKTPGEGDKTIFEICITSPAYKTTKGIVVGSSEADIIKAYGDNYEQVGKCIEYSTSQGTISFLMNGGVVKNISYLMF